MRLQCLHFLISVGVLTTPLWSGQSSFDVFPAEPDPVCAERIAPFSNQEIKPTVRCSALGSGAFASAPPLFANLDYDPESEIVLTHEKGVDVVNPRTCAIKYRIRPGLDLPVGHRGPVLGDADNDGIVDLFLTVGTTIQRWEYDLESGAFHLHWTSSTGVATASSPQLHTVDLNLDGQLEVIPNQGRMVDAATGRVYPGQVPALHPGGNGSFAFSAEAILEQAPAGQSNTELIYGTHIYRYDFAAEEWFLARKHSSLSWGYVTNVSLADMDLDGDLDAVLTRWSVVNQVLIWDMQTDQLLGGGQLNELPGEFGSRMLLANLDPDPQPEMAMSTSSALLVMDDIVNSAGLGTILWEAPTDNYSGNISPTAFDFNNDGRAELIYRDQSRLRIFDGMGSDGDALVLYNRGLSCEAGSHAAYPTIGDIDGDYQAELLLSCSDGIRVIEATDNPWGDSPRIWHSLTYSQPATNTFLAQANLHPVGEAVFIPLPDASLQVLGAFSDCTDQFGLQIRVCNDGAAILPAGSVIKVYPSSSGVVDSLPVSTSWLPATLTPGDCLDIETALLGWPGEDAGWMVAINEERDEVVPGAKVRDCDHSNNHDTYSFLQQGEPQSIQASICHGDAFWLNEKEYSVPGVYHQVLTNQFGCDSLVTIQLSVLERKETVEYQSICEGEVHFFRDQVVDQQGVYRDTLISNETGCDSLVTLILEIIPPAEEYILVSLCEGDSYLSNGVRHSEPGQHTQMLTSRTGCDSLLTIELEFTPPNEVHLVKTICEGETFFTGKRAYTKTGFYRELYKDVDGCDSLVDLTLIVYSAETTYLQAAICQDDQYFFNGAYISEPGFYYDTLTTRRGCDSIVVLDLAILEEPNTHLTALICSGLEFAYNGITYAENGEFSHIFPASNGCDSTVNLKVVHAPSNITRIEYEGCQGESILIGGQLYSEPGTYSGLLSASDGCDSLTHFEITIFPSYQYETMAEICEGETYFFHGREYRDEGVYLKNYPTQFGCDSTFVLDLRVKPISIVHLDSTICEGQDIFFNGRLLSVPGEYLGLGVNQEGCDSLTILKLRIDPLDQLLADGGIICRGDTLQLAAEGSRSGYRWTPTVGLSCSDCPNPLAFPDFTTNYTVIGRSCGDRPVSTEVVVEVLEGPNIGLEKDQTIVKGEEALLTLSGSAFGDGADVVWTMGGDTLCLNCPELLVSPLTTTTYEVRSTNEFGCLTMADATIEVRTNCVPEDFFIPNFFSPNDDGKNDQFFVTPYSGAKLKWLNVYARWGEKVFDADDFGQRWDGTYRNSTPISPGVYVLRFKAECPDGSFFDYLGNITVIK